MKLWVCESCGGPAFYQDEKPGGVCGDCQQMGRPAGWVFREVPGEVPEIPPETLGTPSNPRTSRNNVLGDKVPKHFDWALGEWVNSRSDRKKRYREEDMIMKSHDEMRRHQPTNAPRKPGRITTYPGSQSRRRTRITTPKFV